MLGNILRALMILGIVSLSFGTMAEGRKTVYGDGDYDLVSTINMNKDAYGIHYGFSFCGDGYIFATKQNILSILKIKSDGGVHLEKKINSRQYPSFKKLAYVEVVECMESSEGTYAYVVLNGYTGILRYKSGSVEFYKAKVFWPNPESGDYPVVICGDSECDSRISDFHLSNYNLASNKDIYKYFTKFSFQNKVFLDDYIIVWRNDVSHYKDGLLNKDSYRCLSFYDLKIFSEEKISKCSNNIHDLMKAQNSEIESFAITDIGQFYSDIFDDSFYMCRYKKKCEKINLKKTRGYFIYKTYVAYGEVYYEKASINQNGEFSTGIFCKKIEYIQDGCPIIDTREEVFYRFSYRNSEYIITSDAPTVDVEDKSENIYEYKIRILKN